MVLCTLRDWARFLHCHALDGENYLSPGTARKLRTAYAGDTGYGLGVGVLNRAFAEPDKALNHTGDILGQTSVFWVAPASDLILIAYTNTASAGSASAEARNGAAGMMLARYRDAAPFGPYLDGRVASKPSIRVQPVSVVARPGDAISFAVEADGRGPLEYQWKFNDVPLTGATGPRLTMTAAADDVGYYSVDVRNDAGATSSSPATLALAGQAPEARLSNLSVLARVLPAQPITVGFTLSDGAEPVLVRAVGPGLRSLGVAAPLANPAMRLQSQARLVAENDDWAAGPALTMASAAVGAFPLASGSLDAVLLRTIRGGNTVSVQPSSGAAAPDGGAVLMEVYDAGPGVTARLTNLSVLSHVGPGEGTLTAGFTIAGAGRKRLLIRAVGPGLAALGVAPALSDPRLEVFNADGVRIQQNDNWESDLSTTFTSVGAFSLSPGSADAAVAIDVAAGGYTVRISGSAGASGQALVELYELP